MFRDLVGNGFQIGGFIVGLQAGKRVGIGQAVGDDLAAALARIIHQLRRMIVDFGVEQDRDRQSFAVKAVDQAERADAVAVVAP